MTFAGAVEFYNLSPTTIQNWKRRVQSKATRQTKPFKIPDDVLLNDVKEHPDDYQYERARRLNCSKTVIYHALKRLGISQKKTLEHPKACPIKRAAYQRKLDSSNAILLFIWTKAALSTRPFALMVMHRLVSLVSIATTGKVKSEPMSLVLCIKRCCLRLITLSRTSIAIYFMTGASSHLFQVLKLNA